MKLPNYKIVLWESTHERLVIRDVGPWDQYPAVTNAAEEVVEKLHREGILMPGRRLFYYDSENQFDELLVKDGKFNGFAPGGKP